MSKFCGARPHKMLTLMNWNSIYFFGLSPEVLWKTEWTEKKIDLYKDITKCSARRPLPDNEQMYYVNENTQIAKQIELKAPDSGPTPAVGPRLPPRWPLFLHI